MPLPRPRTLCALTTAAISSRARSSTPRIALPYFPSGRWMPVCVQLSCLGVFAFSVDMSVGLLCTASSQRQARPQPSSSVEAALFRALRRGCWG